LAFQRFAAPSIPDTKPTSISEKHLAVNAFARSVGTSGTFLGERGRLALRAAASRSRSAGEGEFSIK
jgi:hypothetical protein